jgi:hypothetical protein
MALCVIYMWMYIGVHLFDAYSLGYASEVGFFLFNSFHPLFHNRYWFFSNLQLISCISMVVCKIMLLVYVVCCVSC